MLLKTLLGKKISYHKHGIDFDNLQIDGISRDSSSVKAGDAYFCLSNDHEKALACCKEAVERGAAVVLSNFVTPFEKSVQECDVRSVFAYACANFYGRACDDLKIVGVTGTNGKTSTSHIIAQILQRNGKSVGVIGTSGVFYNGKKLPCPLTTPDADFLHKTFADMKNEGVEYVVIEVSAHAIHQKRVEGIKFEVGVLTNITQDHLDYFRTFDAYEQTKLSFMEASHIKRAVVCVDDKSACKLLANCTIPIKTYGLENPADVFAIDISCSMNGSRFVANVCDDVFDVKTNLIGKYNVQNSLAALAVCQELGLSEKELARGLNFINPVEGRFNVIVLDGKYVVIDYAHTPDGLYNVLTACKTLTDKKVYVVFGCGGNRDKDKRAKMGKVAQELADYVCLTDDNPRLEKSEDIIGDIEKGMTKPHFVEKDRKAALEKMVNVAGKGDIIVVAGKGAEKYQEIGTQKIPYNDFDAVYEIFKGKRKIREFYDS